MLIGVSQSQNSPHLPFEYRLRPVISPIIGEVYFWSLTRHNFSFNHDFPTFYSYEVTEQKDVLNGYNNQIPLPKVSSLITLPQLLNHAQVTVVGSNSIDCNGTDLSCLPTATLLLFGISSKPEGVKSKMAKKSKDNGKEDLFKRAMDLHAKLNEDQYEFQEFEFPEIRINKPGWNKRTDRPNQNIELEIEGEKVTMVIENPSLLESFVDAWESYAEGNEDQTISLPVRHRTKGSLVPEDIDGQPTIWIN